MSSIQSLFSSSTKDNLSTQQTLTLIGLAGLTAFLLAVVPFIGLINYPFRLLLTMVHELGHGLAALVTGGKFNWFVIYPNGSGLTQTAGGWRFVIIPAGYLGVALFGAILILLGRSHRWSRRAMAVIGGALIVLTILYGLPTIFSGQIFSGILTMLSGVIFGLIFLWVAVRAAPAWIIFLLHLLAIEAGLTAFSDLITLIGISTRFFNVPVNDAQNMAELTFVPAIVWALLWAIAALLLIGGAIWRTWLVSPNK